MHVIVLPVSGPRFVVQLGITEHLCEAKIYPTLMLASSGGNVCAHIAAAADWKWPAIERISRQLKPNLFVSPWSGFKPAAQIIGYFNGNIHNRGQGVEDFLRNNYTERTLRKYEIWTGTFNRTQDKARLFCNLDKSMLNVDDIDKDLSKSMDPVYINGDISLLSKSSLASASIPAVVPPQIIDDEEYIDGGVAGASPLIIMQNIILNYAQDKNLHIFYINPLPVAEADKSLRPQRNVIDTWKHAAKSIITSQNVLDRVCGYNMVNSLCKDIQKVTFPCSCRNLRYVTKLQQYCRATMLEIQPEREQPFNIIDFTEADIIMGIRKTYGHCLCTLWYGLSAEHPDGAVIVADIINRLK